MDNHLFQSFFKQELTGSSLSNLGNLLLFFVYMTVN